MDNKPHMIIKSTADVPIEILREFSYEVKPELNVKVDGGQNSLRLRDSTSWITFLADADWWIQALATFAAIYIAELVKEGAKETWRRYGKIGSGSKKAGNKIWKLSSEITRLKNRLPKETKIHMEVRELSENFSCNLEISVINVDVLAIQIALFIYHLPAIKDLIATEVLTETGVLGPVQLTLLDDSSIEVSWMDAKKVSREKRILSLENVDG